MVDQDAPKAKRKGRWVWWAAGCGLPLALLLTLTVWLWVVIQRHPPLGAGIDQVERGMTEGQVLALVRAPDRRVRCETAAARAREVPAHTNWDACDRSRLSAGVEVWHWWCAGFPMADRYGVVFDKNGQVVYAWWCGFD